MPYEDKHSQGITWTTDPPVTGSEPCKKRGVLSMVPPDWADSAEIALTFAEEGTGWMFNFGDSPHNNGYGERFLSLADPRGAPGTRPMGVQILSFSCSFQPKIEK